MITDTSLQGLFFDTGIVHTPTLMSICAIKLVNNSQAICADKILAAIVAFTSISWASYNEHIQLSGNSCRGLVFKKSQISLEGNFDKQDVILGNYGLLS